MKTYITLVALFFNLLELKSQNILVSANNQPSEPSITMDFKNPKYLMAAANIKEYYLSQDTGRTWTQHQITSTLGVWGDPALITDTAGSFYYFHLGPPQLTDKIICQKSTNKGQSWNNGTHMGYNSPKVQDKEWSVVDPKNNTIYVTWTQFDEYESSNPSDSSIILFSKSTDGAATWSPAKRINKFAGDCLDGDNTVEGAVPAVGPNGEVYVAWASKKGIMFNKSIDAGNTWMPQEKLIATIPGGWDYYIPGVDRCNGLPICVCDLSNGPNRGTIYVNWSDQRNGTTDTDIWLSKSTDGGNTWSAPIKVNDDNTKRQQFLTWMAVDQKNGNLYFVFYDRRNYTDDQTDVYLARTTDGGNSFVNKRISEKPFIPNNTVFFGDYTNIVAHNGIVRPIWGRMENGKNSIWTDISPIDNIFNGLKDDFSFEAEFLQNAPNPTKDEVYVSFKLKMPSVVSLSLYNMQGELIKQHVYNENRGIGKYVERLNLNALVTEQGIYIFVLEINGFKKAIKQVKID